MAHPIDGRAFGVAEPSAVIAPPLISTATGSMHPFIETTVGEITSEILTCVQACGGERCVYTKGVLEGARLE